MSDLNNDTLTPLLDRLKTQLAGALDTPFPTTASEGIDVLERHLRGSIGEALGNSDTASLTFDPAQLTQYIEFVKEAAVIAHQRKTSDMSSACHDAGVAGVVLISAGTGLHPALGVLGLMIGVYLVLDACS